jgi:cell division transport system permease protein
MTRIRFMIRETSRNLYRYPGAALGSLLSLTLIFFLFDIFWIGAGTSDKLYSDLLGQVQMQVFLNDSVADSTLTPIVSNITDVNGILSARFISREDARQELAEMLGADLLAGYDTLNPLPRSIIVELKPEAKNLASMVSIEQTLRGISNVSDVVYSKEWLAKAESTRLLVSRIGYILGLVILLTAVISSGNSIRLMTRARGGGYRQMLLLGAGKLFVSFPLIIEGALICLFAAGTGWLVIWYGSYKIVFSQFTVVLPPLLQIIEFCLAAALLGCISGFLGIRKLLN